MTPHDVNRAISGALSWLDDPHLLAAIPEQNRGELAEIVWRLGNLAAAVDPWAGEDDGGELSPFGTATERGNP